VRLLKGRIQYAVRPTLPKAFRRNYRIESVGSARLAVLDAYVAGQVEHHPMADERIAARLKRHQIETSADLRALRHSAHGQFRYNLHVVLENTDNLPEIREETLLAVRKMIVGVSEKKKLLLSRAGMAANHVHLLLGCGIDDAPREIALAFLNNLAYAQAMKPAYRYSYYVGTVGEFDLGAMRNAAKE
jgi:REP element-mobilizing transposase RayT